MSEARWTDTQVKKAFANMMYDSEILSIRDKRRLQTLKFSLQEVGDMFGRAVEALKKENRDLKRRVEELEQIQQMSLFSPLKYVTAPPEFVEAYRKECALRATHAPSSE